MIITDLSQLIVSNVFESIGSDKNFKIELPLLRHMVLNSIRAYRMKFGNEYGQIVIATDHKVNWRKSIFPYYKAKRKKQRDETVLDWEHLYRCRDQLQQELDENFSYPVINVEGCEADDIIGVLAKNYNASPVLILSGDNDFLQLHRYPNVKQFAVVAKTYLKVDDPILFMKEKILKGDSGDSVPNIMSGDDQIICGVRQAPVTRKRLDEWTAMSEAALIEKFGSRYIRNKKMMDLNETPPELQSQIIEVYENQLQKVNSGKIFNYFMKNDLRNLMANIGEF